MVEDSIQIAEDVEEDERRKVPIRYYSVTHSREETITSCEGDLTVICNVLADYADMGNIEKRTEEEGTKEVKAEEVEMNRRMTERVRWIDTQTYWYLMQLLNLSTDEAEKKFPWDAGILREVFEGALTVLEKHGYKVCAPYICMPEIGRQYRCTLSECGCESCSCQDEFMEKERLLSNIEDTAAMNGLKIMDGDSDSIIVRNSKADMDFEIRVSQLAG